MANNQIQSRMDRKMTLWDGREIWLDSAVGVLETEQGPLILSVLRETTESRRMEAALRESEARFAQVAEQSMEMIWETDAQGIYTYVSEACVRLLGYRPDEIVGRPALLGSAAGGGPGLRHHGGAVDRGVARDSFRTSRSAC